MNKKKYTMGVVYASRFPLFGAAVALLALTFAPLSASADEAEDEAYHRDYIYGVPVEPTEAWIMSRGGRLYDNWINTQGHDKPKATHSAWPASNTKKKGGTTWRCKSCHGWDYLGSDGKYASGSYKTGIAGVMPSKGKSVDAIAATIRDGTHGFTKKMLSDEQLGYLAAFVSRGLDDMNRYIDSKSGAVKGDPKKGASIFQTNCAACHGFDGRALNWGDEDDPGFVGTEANANPWEVLHKIRNGHPGVEMISLRAFDVQTAVDVLAYTKTLPQK
ncbi:MAG: c-type cytochrome [Alphaproteobacteria bacterium]|nr:c-type cytochrome [Alphaproteobacteria bacterium]